MKKTLLNILRNGRFYAIALAVVAVAVIVVVVVKAWQKDPPISLSVVHNTRIDVTPEEIQSIRDIGQWEFLSISTEEMVEWHRHRTFGNDHLVRIYQGTLRIGVDMAHAKEDWLQSLPDSTAIVHLPAIGLLDNQFIDEARTRTFYEKGSIPPAILDQLYATAAQKMRHRCLTPQNLKRAENNARTHFDRIVRAMGFKRVEIVFDKK